MQCPRTLMICLGVKEMEGLFTPFPRAQVPFAISFDELVNVMTEGLEICWRG